MLLLWWLPLLVKWVGGVQVAEKSALHHSHGVSNGTLPIRPFSYWLWFPVRTMRNGVLISTVTSASFAFLVQGKLVSTLFSATIQVFCSHQPLANELLFF